MVKSASNKLSITACLVVHNEESVISRCLESIKNLVDEIYIVHDGPCTDHTVSICKRYTPHVFECASIGEAEPHRAWLFSQVKSDWILQLDSDEYLSKDLATNLHSLCLANDVDAYTFIWPYWNGKKYCTKTWPRKKSLFRTKKIEFLAFPHEEVRTSNTVDTHLILEHQPPYDNYTWGVFKQKWVRWAKIHSKYFRKNPKTLDHFPKSSTNLVPHYYAESKKPFVYAIPLSLYHFAGSYLLGGWREGWAGLKISAMTALYYFVIFATLAKSKHE